MTERTPSGEVVEALAIGYKQGWAEAESSLRARLVAEVEAKWPKDPKSVRMLVDRAAVLRVISGDET